jgi:hypothetical protein
MRTFTPLLPAAFIPLPACDHRHYRPAYDSRPWADISGKLLARYEVNDQTTVHVDLSQYASGIYYLTYLDGETPHTGKIILYH